MNQRVAVGFWLPVFLFLVLLGTCFVAYLLGYFDPAR
jgi:hypothetical protein